MQRSKKSKKKKMKKNRKESSDSSSDDSGDEEEEDAGAVMWVEKTCMDEHQVGPEAPLTHLSQDDKPLEWEHYNYDYNIMSVIYYSDQNYMP